MDWTSEAIDQLRALWAEGHSTAEIGRRMGISKNAVVGKAHRLNLDARPSPIRREPGEARAAAPRAATAPVRRAPPAILPRPAPLPVARRPDLRPPAASPLAAAPMARLAPGPVAPVAVAPPPRPVVSAIVRPFPRASLRSCCWPMGEPGTAEFRFCGDEALAGKPYCPDHAAVAYVKVRDRREDAA